MAAPQRNPAVRQTSADAIPPLAPRHPPKTSAARLLTASAFVLLAAWLLALLFAVGEFAHVLLLVGLMLLMMAGLKAREAAMRTAVRADREDR